MMVSEKSPHPCKTVVVLVGSELRPFTLGVSAHAAEFVDKKRAAVKTYSFLLVYSRASVLAFYKDIAYKEKRREYYEAEKRDAKINTTFEIAPGLCHSVFNIVFSAEQGY